MEYEKPVRANYISKLMQISVSKIKSWLNNELLNILEEKINYMKE